MIVGFEPMTDIPDLHSAREQAWQEALRREAVIRPLAVLPAIKRADLDDAASRLGLAKTRIYDLIARYREKPLTSSLLVPGKGFPQGPNAP